MKSIKNFLSSCMFLVLGTKDAFYKTWLNMLNTSFHITFKYEILNIGIFILFCSRAYKNNVILMHTFIKLMKYFDWFISEIKPKIKPPDIYPGLMILFVWNNADIKLNIILSNSIVISKYSLLYTKPFSLISFLNCSILCSYFARKSLQLEMN